MNLIVKLKPSNTNFILKDDMIFKQELETLLLKYIKNNNLDPTIKSVSDTNYYKNKMKIIVFVLDMVIIQVNIQLHSFFMVK